MRIKLLPFESRVQSNHRNPFEINHEFAAVLAKDICHSTGNLLALEFSWELLGTVYTSKLYKANYSW